MPVVCPTILAANKDDYDDQVKKIANLGKRIQIDLTDGKFAPTKTVAPQAAWWPAGFMADIHLMFKDPLPAAKSLTSKEPNMIIAHAESDGNFDKLHELCRHLNIKLGLALLPATPPELIDSAVKQIDHVLIFSGDLGSFGGHADLGLLDKVVYLKSKNPDLEIGWDGGINDRNISQLVFGGVDVLNVGGYIQNADDPEKAYNSLFRIADETGIT
jgi:ribulose-phosphate 3-epimerase